jgi:hypothetical protein
MSGFNLGKNHLKQLVAEIQWISCQEKCPARPWAGTRPAACDRPAAARGTFRARPSPEDAEGEVKVTAEDSRTIRFDPRDIAIILPIDQIGTATLFDERVYAFLNRERDPRAWRALSGSQSGT